MKQKFISVQAIISALLLASAHTQIYRNSTDGDIHGEWSAEIRDILRRAERDPEVLRELAPLPLEQTYRALLQRRSPNIPSYEPMREIARKTLYEHPDLEGYIGRHLRRMAELLEPEKPRATPENREQVEQRDIAASNIVGYINFAATLEGDGAFRLLGPRLFDRAWEADYGDTLSTSHGYYAVDHLRSLIRKRFPGEPEPVDLEGMKAWWKANEQRFAVKPKAAVPVAVEPRPVETPSPPSQPTPRPRVHFKAATPEPKTAVARPSQTGSALLVLGALASLAVVAELVRRFRHRK